MESAGPDRGSPGTCPRVSTRMTRNCSASAPTHGSHISLVEPIEFSNTNAGASEGPSLR